MQAKPRWVPSLSLTRRVTETALAHTLSRMKILERIPGNPIGIAYRKFADMTALSARDLPSPSFNTIIGLRAGRAHRVYPMIDWSREHGGSGRFDIAAGD